MLNLNSTTLSYIMVFFTAAFFLLPALDLVRNKEAKGLRKITTTGWIFLVVSMLFCYLSVLSVRANSSEQVKNKHTQDSIRNAEKQEFKNDVNSALKEYGLKLKQNSTGITVVDTVKKIVEPILDVFAERDSINPKIEKSTGYDSAEFRILYCCINKGIAFNIRDKIVLFHFMQGKMVVNGATHRSANESLTAYINDKVNHALELKQGLSLGRLNPAIDTTYFYFKVVYSDSQIRGKDEEPLRKLYYTITPPFPKSWKDFSQIREIDSQDRYVYLKKELIIAGYW